MTISSVICALATKLSLESRVLCDETSPEFKESMIRWSEYGVQVPSAIVQPAVEVDVVIAIKELTSASIPFVPASGGHSPFSSVGKDGVIIDLSRFKGVEVDDTNGLATVKGGTLMKELQTTLHGHKRFAAVGSGSTVGAIPYYIGGGISAYSPFTGFGCENIVAATMVTAHGDLVYITEAHQSELLWGLRGAGQFLGLVTQITIKTYPYNLLGNSEGQRMIGTYAFTPDKLDAVCAAMITLMESKAPSAGHFTITLAPPDYQHQVLLAMPQVFTSAKQAAKLCQPLLDLGPVLQSMEPSTFDKHSDHIDYLCANGSFKRFTQIGMTSLTADKLRALVALHSELGARCPDAKKSAFTVEWHSDCKRPHEDTAFGVPRAKYWLNVLSWYQDANNHAIVESFDKRAQEASRAGDKEDDFVTYTNTNREDPIAWRYCGKERIAALKALKKKWDPCGVFTKELL